MGHIDEKETSGAPRWGLCMCFWVPGIEGEQIIWSKKGFAKELLEVLWDPPEVGIGAGAIFLQLRTLPSGSNSAHFLRSALLWASLNSCRFRLSHSLVSSPQHIKHLPSLRKQSYWICITLYPPSHLGLPFLVKLLGRIAFPAFPDLASLLPGSSATCKVKPLLHLPLRESFH